MLDFFLRQFINEQEHLHCEIPEGNPWGRLGGTHVVSCSHGDLLF